MRKTLGLIDERDECQPSSASTERTRDASDARLASPGRLLYLATATLGAVGLLGSVTGEALLTSFVPDQPPMMPNTAVALLLLGIAGGLRPRARAGRAATISSLAAALVVLAIAVGTLLEYGLETDLHIDQIFVRSTAGPLPGRPSPLTALALTLLALAVFVVDYRPTARARPSEWLALVAALVAFVGLIGLVLGAGPLYRMTHAPIIGVALPTAIGLLLTSVALLLERPAAGLMRVATSPGSGGVMLRRLALPTLLVPVLLGLVVMRLSATLGLEDVALSFAVLAATTALGGLALLTITAVPLNRTHELLEATRRRTRELVDEAADGIFVADLDGRYVDVNRAGCRMLGYRREEIIGRTIVDLIPPEDVERLWEAKEQLVRGGAHVAEWSLRRKNGSYLPVEVSAKILPGGRWQGLVRDIGERKRLEHALRFSEAKARGIVSISVDAIVSIDGDRRITMFNGGAEKIFGWSSAEVIGAPLEILIPERLRAAHTRYVEGFAAGQAVARRMGERGAEIFGLRKNGEEFPADAAISKLEVDHEQILTVTVRDVTQAKRIERETKFLADIGAVLSSTLGYEETLTNITNLAVGELADVCIVETAEEDGPLNRLNVAHRDPRKAAIATALGQIRLEPRRSYLGSSVFETKQPLVMEAVTTEYLESIAQSDEHLRALRELDPKSFMALPLVAHGRLLGSMVLLDTTASHRYAPRDLELAEEVARRAAYAVENARLYRAARRATQARDDVLGIVAHDLRNPLNIILMQAQLLRHQGAGAAHDARQSMETIERAVARMKRLIQDLLDVTRMEAGHLSLDRARVSIGQVLAESVKAQMSPGASSSPEIRLDVARDAPEVLADRDRLLQVFENLIGNAVKFTPPAGRITVGAAPSGEREALCWVADTGAGIAADDLPHVFDRFWQAPRGARHGAGLGLPIVKGIVEAHGGRVWVESTPGCGSTFFFTIPTAESSERPQPRS